VTSINKKGGDTMNKCVVCKGEVNWDDIKEEFAEILEQADTYGPDSLTEKEQVVWEGSCCGRECFDKLE